jgi:acyl-CoA synthetase (AMP-forming)/AMP-acid ligase II
MNVWALPDLRAGQNPHGPCVADDDIEFDNEMFAATVRRAAAALQAHGVSAGDVVAVMLPNTSALVVALFAS